ncbi:MULTISPECIES: hypothetical protein [Bacillaceae]|uniref:hypothetical protein n=1 Tax=Bacillaceae TaxID=186817 RepID=UPI0006620D06|nr:MULTISPECIES: hypothetical protein [Bacillaceae]MCF7625516.1 hypothetical protein [Peribacillus frigoritolerans]PRA73236.1 hypothetical protein CQ056_28285 [Peribacillus simplex]
MKFCKKNKDNNESFNFSEHISDLGFIMLIFAILSPFIGILIVKGFNLGDVFADLGVYGDFLGGSTLPFLTIVTIAFVYKTFKLQEEQLKTQKEEMEETRETLREQNKTAQLQRFENSFFIQLKDIKDKKDGHYQQGIQSGSLRYGIIQGIPKLIDNMNIHFANEFNDSKDKDIKWRNYKNHMKFCFEDTTLVFKKIEFKNYIFSIMRCFQLLNRYKEIMDDDEQRYYLQYVIDEIGDEVYRLSMFFIVAFSERYEDFFKALKSLKTHRHIKMSKFDKELPSSTHFLNHYLD